MPVSFKDSPRNEFQKMLNTENAVKLGKKNPSRIRFIVLERSGCHGNRATIRCQFPSRTVLETSSKRPGTRNGPFLSRSLKKNGTRPHRSRTHTHTHTHTNAVCVPEPFTGRPAFKRHGSIRGSRGLPSSHNDTHA